MLHDRTDGGDELLQPAQAIHDEKEQRAQQEQGYRLQQEPDDAEAGLGEDVFPDRIADGRQFQHEVAAFSRQNPAGQKAHQQHLAGDDGDQHQRHQRGDAGDDAQDHTELGRAGYAQGQQEGGDQALLG